MKRWIEKIFNKKDRNEENKAEETDAENRSKTDLQPKGAADVIAPDLEPDEPSPFGYKATWYAIKGETSLSTIEKLGLNPVSVSNWASGLRQADRSDQVFVSPLINGYVLAISLTGLMKDDEQEQIKEHGARFEELQYFGSHRIVDYYAWAKFQGGKLIRAYSYVGDIGEITWNEGNITDEEVQLHFDQFPQSGIWNGEDTLPNEEDVIDIAKAWGIDPTFSDQAYEKSTGYICSRKK